MEFQETKLALFGSIHVNLLIRPTLMHDTKQRIKSSEDISEQN